MKRTNNIVDFLTINIVSQCHIYERLLSEIHTLTKQIEPLTKYTHLQSKLSP